VIASIQLGSTVPLLRTVGGLADDEVTRAWLDAIEENRQVDDENERKRVETVSRSPA